MFDVVELLPEGAFDGDDGVGNGAQEDKRSNIETKIVPRQAICVFTVHFLLYFLMNFHRF